MKKICILALLILALPFASATYLTMKTSADIILIGDALTVDLSTVNQGDESAHNIQFAISLVDDTVASEIKDVLSINEKFSWKHTFTHAFAYPGTYPLIITTNYQDANGYPFSALSVAPFNYKENIVSDVFGTIENAEISKKGTILVKIKNNANKERSVNLRLIAPKELSFAADEQNFFLNGKEEKSVKASIESFSALAGSKYAIFAILEYDENGKHYLSTATGTVAIVNKKELFFMPYWLIAILAVALVLIFVILQWKRI